MAESVLVYLAMGLIIPISMEKMGQFFRPRSQASAQGMSAYESGIPSQSDTWQPQYLRYYSYALIFVLFDAETAFLYPWAAAFDKVPKLFTIQAIVFVMLLLGGLIYAWKKGVMEWI